MQDIDECAEPPAEIILRAREIGFTADEITNLNRVYVEMLSKDEVGEMGNTNARIADQKASRKESTK